MAAASITDFELHLWVTSQIRRLFFILSVVAALLRHELKEEVGEVVRSRILVMTHKRSLKG